MVVHLEQEPDGNWIQTDHTSVFQKLIGRIVDGKQSENTGGRRRAVEIDVCPVCMGAWFDAGELDVLSGDLGSVDAVLAPDSRVGVRPCPQGHGAMVEQNLPGVISTPVDRCLRCNGIWLDGDERRKLARATTSEGQGTKTSRWIKRGAIWAAQVLTHLPVEVDNPARGTPWVVFGLLATLLLVFEAQIHFLHHWDLYGLVSGRLVRNLHDPKELSTLLSYMFLHATWIHLLGNSYFLYTFGDNVEHLFGRVRFLLFFVGAGVVGGLCHVAFSKHTADLVVGASGCISGVLGAYLWAFPRQRLFQVILWIQVKIPMWVYLFVWVGFQVAMGFFAVGDAAKGTAWFAHLGGFLLGLAVTPWVLRWRRKSVGRSVRVPAPLPPGSPAAEPEPEADATDADAASDASA